MQANDDAAAIYGIERPSPKLMYYYALKCLIAGPFYPIILIPHYFRYHTLRYRFNDEGISMRWGILFRREVILNYSRIRTFIHSNVVERAWLAKVEIKPQAAAPMRRCQSRGLTSSRRSGISSMRRCEGSKSQAKTFQLQLPTGGWRGGPADLANTLRVPMNECDRATSSVSPGQTASSHDWQDQIDPAHLVVHPGRTGAARRRAGIGACFPRGSELLPSQASEVGSGASVCVYRHDSGPAGALVG